MDNYHHTDSKWTPIIIQTVNRQLSSYRQLMDNYHHTDSKWTTPIIIQTVNGQLSSYRQ